MSSLTTTLRARLDAADEKFAQGRPALAQRAYEELVERAQERNDRAIETAARAMLARCLLSRNDLDRAATEIALAERTLDRFEPVDVARFEAARVRVALARDPSTGRGFARDYLAWAEPTVPSAAIDACELLARDAPDAERAHWLEKALEIHRETGADGPVGEIAAALAAALERLDRLDEAIDAWESARSWWERRPAGRALVASTWAVGALALRLDDVPLAEKRLQAAIALGQSQPESGDLVALATADLARLTEASGDVVEARRLLLRALELGRAHDLASTSPDRWASLRAFAKHLELD